MWEIVETELTAVVAGRLLPEQVDELQKLLDLTLEAAEADDIRRSSRTTAPFTLRSSSTPATGARSTSSVGCAIRGAVTGS